ncbi:DNA (cytosine-5-)-methyltransferase [Streptococcus mutans]|nr:DNA (cytosine-5-)-methyltransferase [Streptococcus mutans]
MKVVELFAGIGGFKLGIDQVYSDAEYVLVSEIDRHAQKSYEAMHHIVPEGDITQIRECDIADHDLLVGGFPCQAFSIAGQRKGFEDTRGTMFFEMARIAKEKRPKVILAENVKGLVNHDKGNTIAVMVKTLNQLGYIVDFEVLTSSYHGVPQNRERVFIIAVRGDLENHEEWVTKGTTMIPKRKREIAEDIETLSFNFDWDEPCQVTTSLFDIMEDDAEVDPKYYLDEEKSQALLVEMDAAEKQQPVPQDPIMIGHLNMKGHDAIRRVYHHGAPGPTLTTMGGGHREPKVYTPHHAIRKLTPLECFRLQGFTDEQHQACVDAGVSNSQLYKQSGNAVTVNVIAHIMRQIKKAGYLD